MIISGAKPTNQSKIRYLNEIQKNCYWYIDDRFGYDWGSSTLIGMDNKDIPDDANWETPEVLSTMEFRPFTYIKSGYKFNVKKRSKNFKWLLIDNSDIEEKVNLLTYLNSSQNLEMSVFFTRNVSYIDSVEFDYEFSYDPVTKVFTLTTVGQGNIPSFVGVNSYIVISYSYDDPNKKKKYKIATKDNTTFTLKEETSTGATLFEYIGLTVLENLTIKVVYEANIRKENYDLDYNVEQVNFVGQGVYQPSSYFTGMTLFVDNSGNAKIYGLPITTMNMIFDNTLNITESIFDVVTNADAPRTIITGLKLFSKYKLNSTNILIFKYSTDSGQKSIIVTQEVFAQDYAIFPDSVISEIGTGVLNNSVQAPLYERFVNDNYLLDSLMINDDTFNERIFGFNKIVKSVSDTDKMKSSFCALSSNNVDFTLTGDPTADIIIQGKRTEFVSDGGVFAVINGIEYICTDDYDLALKHNLNSLLCQIKYDYFKVLNLIDFEDYPTGANAGDRVLMSASGASGSYVNATIQIYSGSNWTSQDYSIGYVYNTTTDKWFRKVINEDLTWTWIETFAGEYFKRIFIFSTISADTICEYICHVPRGRLSIDNTVEEYDHLELNLIL